MAKKKIGKHLQFYMDCMRDRNRLMPCHGLCRCALLDYICGDVLEKYFTPEDFSDAISFWASGKKGDCEFIFTPLRQTIVLFMAAINNEL